MSRQMSQMSDATRTLLQQIQMLRSELQSIRDALEDKCNALEESQEEGRRMKQTIVRYGEEINALKAQLSPEAKTAMLENAKLRSQISRLQEQLAGRQSFHDAFVNGQVEKQVADITQQLKERTAMQVAAVQGAYEARAVALKSKVLNKEGEIAGLKSQLSARDAEIAGLRSQLSDRDAEIAGQKKQQKSLPESTLPESVKPASRVSFHYGRSRSESRSGHNEQTATTTLPVIPSGR